MTLNHARIRGFLQVYPYEKDNAKFQMLLQSFFYIIDSLLINSIALMSLKTIDPDHANESSKESIVANNLEFRHDRKREVNSNSFDYKMQQG